MASTREIRQRIRSVNNIAKITNAMQLIASSKMRRAQQRVLASRLYTESLAEIVSRVALSVPEERRAAFPILSSRPAERVLLVLITPDRGLAGALVGNALRAFMREVDAQQGRELSVVTMGKRGQRLVARMGLKLVASYDMPDSPRADEIMSFTSFIVSQYAAGEVDEVKLVYTKFINTVNQSATVAKLLPIEISETEDAASEIDYIYEPNIYEMLRRLLPLYAETLAYQSILEANASEHSARMVAMRNATDNARSLNQELTLEYNRARQEYITSELLDIVGGAVALEA